MIKTIRNFLKNKDGKTLMENFASLSILQLVNIALPLITLPYVLRVLGTSNYGIIVIALAVVSSFQSVTDYSFAITATRDISIFRNSKRKLNLIYNKVMTIKFIILFFAFLILTFLVLFYPPFYEEKIVFFLTFPMLFGHVIFPTWFFQGVENMKYISVVNVGAKIFFTICIFVFINQKSDYWIYPLLNSLGYVSAGVVAQFLILKKYRIKPIWITLRIIKSTLRINFPIFINQFLPNLYNNGTTILLGIIVNSNAVGIYDAIKKVIELCVTLIRILSRTFFPFLNRRKDAFPKFLKLMLIVGSILSILPILFSQFIFWYLNIDAENAFVVISIFSIGIFFFTLYNIFGANYFLVLRKDNLIMLNTLFATITALIVAFPLIYFFGIIGAAINLSLSRGLMGVGLLVKYATLKET